MAEQSVQTLLFPDLFAKPLMVQFDTPQLSSDGGAISRKVPDSIYALTS